MLFVCVCVCGCDWDTDSCSPLYPPHGWRSIMVGGGGGGGVDQSTACRRFRAGGGYE